VLSVQTFLLPNIVSMFNLRQCTYWLLYIKLTWNQTIRCNRRL